MADIVVIGAGAAGMMAAVMASAEGNRVLLLEKNEKPGKKIYITGKGRCNFTNDCGVEEFMKNTVSNPRFLYSAVSSFSPRDMMDFLKESGCPVKVERGRRAFPASDHASDVTKALVKRMKAAGVSISLNTEAKGISSGAGGRGFMIRVRRQAGVNKVSSTGRSYDKSERRGNGEMKYGRSEELIYADRVIVATGGLSYPATGSTGDGYRFASEFGINCRETRPSLVPLIVFDDDIRGLQNVTLKNVSIRVRLSESGRSGTEDADGGDETAAGRGEKEILRSEPGELTFTGEGLGGPLILTASSVISRYLGDTGHGLKCGVIIDLKPGLSAEMLDRRVLRDFDSDRNMDMDKALAGLLIKSLIPVVLKRAGIPFTKKVRDLTKKERDSLLHVIKNLEFHIAETSGFDEAIVTQGGVDVKEIDPKTMESKKVGGLYFAGEVLDLDALTGGFNLQIAWSTGAAAGRAASR